MIMGKKAKKTIGAVQNQMGTPQELAAQMPGMVDPNQQKASDRDAMSALAQAAGKMMPKAA